MSSQFYNDQIPQVWHTTTLDNVGEIITGGTPSTTNEKFWNGEIAWITPTDIGDKKDIFIGERSITQDGLKAIRELPANSLLVTCVASIGKNAILRTRGSCNQQINAVIPNENFNVDFLYYLLEFGKERLKNLAGITATLIISKALFSKFEISYPNFTEQTKIAQILSDMDDLISAKCELLDKKRAIKQAVAQQLLTPKPHWHTATLGDISLIKTGSRNNQDKNNDGEFPFFVRSATVERISTYSYDCEAILIPGEGGIGSIYHYINGKFDAHQRVYVIRDFNKDIDAKFIFYVLKEYFGKYALQNTVKATVDSLRLPTFQNFEFSLPKDKAEQTKIAEILSDMDKEISALQDEIEKLKMIKQGAMDELLSGKIRLKG